MCYTKSIVSEVKSFLVAAHELKAPLSLVRQLALSLQISEDQQTQERICHQMVNVTDRALLQVNDLIKITQLDHSLFPMEPVSVRGVCESVARDVTPIFGYDRKHLSIHYRNRHRLAVANSELLYSVIYNFCANALHYADTGTTSRLSVSDSQHAIRIDVRDFGPALPTEVWHNLQRQTAFQPSKISLRPGSSSLGLYIATQFAGFMHATVGAVRHRDGTSFFVDLPISTQTCLFGS